MAESLLCENDLSFLGVELINLKSAELAKFPLDFLLQMIATISAFVCIGGCC